MVEIDDNEIDDKPENDNIELDLNIDGRLRGTLIQNGFREYVLSFEIFV